MELTAGRRVANKERVLIAMVNDGLWSIRDDGTIWRVAEKRWCKSINANKVVAMPPKHIDRKTCNYFTVQANIAGKVTPCLSHRLVWQHAYGDIPSGLWINHKNGLKHDNRIENLELVTHSENLRHAFATGLACNKGERNPISKLTDSQASEIRRKRAAGLLLSELAQEYGVSETAISYIALRRTYNHLP